jgi:hypothetical protein
MRPSDNCPEEALDFRVRGDDNSGIASADPAAMAPGPAGAHLVSTNLELLMTLSGRFPQLLDPRLGQIALALMIAVHLGGPLAVAHADETPVSAAPADAALTTWAMHWFTEAMASRTDRSQYAPAFAPQVTDEAVARMAHDLNAYGAAPLRAEIVQSKKDGDETFATIKFVFPRGDATSLMFGFDAAGKITGVAVGAMAGD